MKIKYKEDKNMIRIGVFIIGFTLVLYALPYLFSIVGGYVRIPVNQGAATTTQPYEGLGYQ